MKKIKEGGEMPPNPPVPPQQAAVLMADAVPYLIACGAAGLEALGVVPATVDLPILVEVDQVNQQLIADTADEAGRVPADAMSRS